MDDYYSDDYRRLSDLRDHRDRDRPMSRQDANLLQLIDDAEGDLSEAMESALRSLHGAYIEKEDE